MTPGLQSTTTTISMKSFLLADHGPALRAAADRLVPFVALIIVAIQLLAELAFDLGRQLRLAIEARSEQLAHFHVDLLGLTYATGMEYAVAATVESVNQRGSYGRGSAQRGVSPQRGFAPLGHGGSIARVCA